MTCINFTDPKNREIVSNLKNDLENVLNEKQIGLLWNKWVDEDLSRGSIQPTKQDILEIFTRLSQKDKQDVFDNESIGDKVEAIDALQYLFFYYAEHYSGKNYLTKEDLKKYEKEIYNGVKEITSASGLNFIAENFDNYFNYLMKTRLSKFQVPEVDLDEIEGRSKDTVGENNSTYSRTVNRASDEVIFLIASLNSNETVLNVPKPVNFDKTWNTLQIILANSTTLPEQINKLIASNEPFARQILDKLGIVDENDWMSEKDFGKVRTSFFGAFSQQQKDIIIAGTGGTDSYSAIDSKLIASFKASAKSAFYKSPISHKVNGKTVINKEAYKELNLGISNESVVKFLNAFGIPFQGEVTKDIYGAYVSLKKYLDNALVKGDVEWLDDPAVDSLSKLNTLLKSQLPYLKKDKHLSVRNAEGKEQNAASNHNYFSKITSKLTNGFKEATNAFEKLFAEGKAQLALVSGLVAKNKVEKATFNKLNRGDIYTTLLSDMFSAKPIIHLPKTSDKASENGTILELSDNNDEMAFTNISDKIINKFYNAFQLDKNQKLSPNWDYGADSPMTFWEALGITKDSTKENFKETVLNYIESQREQTIKELKDDGVVDASLHINFNNRVANILANEEHKSSYDNLPINQKQEILNQIVDNFNFNTLYFGVQSTQMLYGSMVGVKVANIFKRFAGGVAESRSTRTDSYIVNKLNEEMASFGMKGFDAKTLRVMVHETTKDSSKDKDILKVSKDYNNIDVDDAQGIMILPMYKVLLDMTGQWTDKQEAVYQKIMKGEKLSPKEYKGIFPPVKPVGYTTIDENGHKIPVYIKTAVYPISPYDTKGLANEDKWNAALENGIGLFIPKTGIKMAIPKNLKPLYENGEFQLGPTFDFPMEFFGVQLDINPKESMKQLIGTQIRKLLTVNLFKNGQAVEPKYKEWVDKNIATYQEIADIEREKLFEKAGITIEDGTPTIVNYSKLKEMVEDELISRDMPINIVESLKAIIDNEGQLLGTIDGLPARQKVMNLLNSIVTNRLIKLTTNGTALVQLSQQGWELKSIGKNPTDEEILAIDCAIDFVNNEAKIAYYKNKGLGFFTKGENTGEAEILLPAKYKAYVREDGTLDPKVIVNIGYRIPTQGHNSMLHLKVVGYLPAHLDQMIVMPKEITTQGGSDFDVDKINLFIPNTITLGKETKFISMDMKGEEVWKELQDQKLIKQFGEESFKMANNLMSNFLNIEEEGEVEIDEAKFLKDFRQKQLQNEIITQTVEILSDPNVYKSLVTPNTAEPLKQAADKIADFVQNTLKESPKKLSVDYHNLFMGTTAANITYQMAAAKALVGVFASQSTHHSLGQQVGLHIVTDREIFFDINRVNGNPDLSGTTNINGELISDRLGNNYLTAAVDAAKEDYLTELGVNLQTGAETALFERLGGNSEYFFNWVNQPIIQAYLNTLKKNESLTVKGTGNEKNKTESIEEVLTKFNLSKDSLQYTVAKNKKLSKDKKANNIDNILKQRKTVNKTGFYTVEELKTNWENQSSQVNAHLLDDFLHFQDLASMVKKSISTSKFDTSGPGKDIIDTTLLRLNYESFRKEMDENSTRLATIKDGVEAPYGRLIHDTLLNVFYNNSFNFVENIYKNLVAFTKNTAIKSAVEGLIHPSFEIVTKSADSTQASLIYGTAVNYIIQNYFPLREDLMFGDNTVAHKILNIQNDPKDPLHNNDIIQEFFNIELAGSDDKPSILAPRNKSISTEESNNFTSKFEEIKEINPELYKELLTISLYQSGVVYSPSSFYSYVSNQDMIPMVSEAIKNFIPDNSYDIMRMVLANIGPQLKNLKVVRQGKYNIPINGILKTRNIENKFVKFIGGSRNNEGKWVPKVEIYEKISENTYKLIEPKNDGQMYYNLNSDGKSIPYFEEEFSFEEEIDEVESNEEETEQPEDNQNVTAPTYEEWLEDNGVAWEDEEWNKDYYNKCIKGK